MSPAASGKRAAEIRAALLDAYRYRDLRLSNHVRTLRMPGRNVTMADILNVLRSGVIVDVQVQSPGKETYELEARILTEFLWQ